MLLRKFSVENFKSVDFSNEVEIGRITCLMGKNESGKTALLEALYKLNPVEAEVAKYNDLEYPRKKLGDLRNEGGVRTKNVITTWWELTDRYEFLEGGVLSTKEPERVDIYGVVVGQQ